MKKDILNCVKNGYNFQIIPTYTLVKMVQIEKIKESGEKVISLFPSRMCTKIKVVKVALLSPFRYNI